MASHRFKVGQTLNYSASRMGNPSPPQPCKVMRLLPAEGGQFQYRIKCNSESVERVVKEAALSLRG